MNNVATILHRYTWFLAAAFVFAVLFVSGIAGLLPTPTIELRWSDSFAAVSDRYVPSYTSRQGREIVMVYIGSSACDFANLPEVPELVERTKLALQQQAVAKGFGFSVIGLSVDWDTDNGLQHLSQFGRFDEILTGRKWQGMGPRLLGLPELAATPQVLVIIRSSESPSMGQSNQVFGGNVVVRKAGFSQIAAWLERGVPLPADLLKDLPLSCAHCNYFPLDGGDTGYHSNQALTGLAVRRGAGVNIRAPAAG